MKTIIERNGSTFPVIGEDFPEKVNEILRPLIGKVPKDLPEGFRYSVAIVVDEDFQELRSIVIADLKRGHSFACWSEALREWVHADDWSPLEFETVEP